MGGNTAKIPNGYTPSWQAGADQSYQSLIQGTQPYVSALPGQVIPGSQTAANNIVNNPYTGLAQNTANTVAQIGTSQADAMNNRNINLDQWAGLDQMLSNWQSQALGGYAQSSTDAGAKAAVAGQGAMAAGQQGYGQTQSLIPSTTGGAQYAGQALGQANNLANLTSNTALSAIPGLTGGMGAANQILQTGFDPQSALYDRTAQQTMDSQNALNSMYGLGSSAYGAGLAGDAMKNFNIDWQNNQLSRQTQALGAYGTEQGIVQNNLSSLLNGASNNYANLSNAGVGQYNSLTSTAANNMDNLVNTGNNVLNQGVQTYQQGQMDRLSALGQAGNLTSQAVTNAAGLNSNAASLFNDATNQGLSSLQTLLDTSSAPSSAYTSQQQAALQALGLLGQNAGQALQPTQGLSQMLSDYLGLGQSATKIQQDAVAANNKTQSGLSSGVGNLIGTAASVAMHFL